MKRASPIKHEVSSHRRSGAKVRHYVRGHGKRPAELKVNRVSSFKKSPTQYLVTVSFQSGKSRGFSFNIDSPQAALDRGIASSPDNEVPMKVTMTRVTR